MLRHVWCTSSTTATGASFTRALSWQRKCRARKYSSCVSYRTLRATTPSGSPLPHCLPCALHESRLVMNWLLEGCSSHSLSHSIGHDGECSVGLVRAETDFSLRDALSLWGAFTHMHITVKALSQSRFLPRWKHIAAWHVRTGVGCVQDRREISRFGAPCSPACPQCHVSWQTRLQLLK